MNRVKFAHKAASRGIMRSTGTLFCFYPEIHGPELRGKLSQETGYSHNASVLEVRPLQRVVDPASPYQHLLGWHANQQLLPYYFRANKVREMVQSFVEWKNKQIVWFSLASMLCNNRARSICPSYWWNNWDWGQWCDFHKRQGFISKLAP